MNNLVGIEQATEIKELDKETLTELQRALQTLDYYDGQIDGLFGPKTKRAWREFKQDNWLSNPELIGPASATELLKIYRSATPYIPSLPESITPQVFKQELQDVATELGLPLKTQMAYMLATVQHETNETYQPVREAYWLSEEWRRNNLRYYPYYGRGYVQLTWRSNYAKYEEITGRPLVNNPELVMEPGVALFILVHGFKRGTFTGHKLEDYVNEQQTDYYHARQCINILDKASKIAEIAESWEAQL